MRENDWTETIKDLINESHLGEGIIAETLVKMPNSNEIVSYDMDFKPKEYKQTRFETDLLIYEKDHDSIKPRLIIEAKINTVTTHDAITYSYKAEQHKNVTPYIRYGIMLGNRKHYPLPGRLYRHGTNFDFMAQFKTFEPTEDEISTFLELIVKEIQYSRQMEEMIYSSYSRSRKRYSVLHKDLRLEKMDD